MGDRRGDRHSDRCRRTHSTISHFTSHAVCVPGLKDRRVSLFRPFGWREMSGCQAWESNVKRYRELGRFSKTTAPFCSTGGPE
jgi:hypothetical protein